MTTDRESLIGGPPSRRSLLRSRISAWAVRLVVQKRQQIGRRARTNAPILNKPTQVRIGISERAIHFARGQYAGPEVIRISPDTDNSAWQSRCRIKRHYGIRWCDIRFVHPVFMRMQSCLMPTKSFTEDFDQLRKGARERGNLLNVTSTSVSYSPLHTTPDASGNPDVRESRPCEFDSPALSLAHMKHQIAGAKIAGAICFNHDHPVHFLRT